MRKLTERQFVARTATLLAVLAALAAARLGAQGAPPASAPAKAAAPASAPAVTPAAAPTPTPSWPANAAPTPAVVEWDSHGLRISAKNASLRQILTEVSSRTGATLEGMGADERVFGEYGPAPAKEVLAQLLHGSAYNVMLIGDQGQGTPRQIVLSTPSASNPTQGQHSVQPAQNTADDDPEPVVDDTPIQQPPPMPRPPMNPGSQSGQPGQPLPPGQAPPPPL
ncbi:hypothetical protein [Terracidiphilus gabretensis]|uniref:hypothetical protein n=1 Tax=Terracidiphilus gabretensis TaxID=1577687 RepID=UPI00071B8714|nr:hypothetical protein [Terracidiphilus gabretensis]